MKVGYQGAYIRVKNWFFVNEPQLAYRFNQGVPNQFTFRLPEWHQSDRTGTAALYVQDKWTRGRLTLQGALRYDRAWSFTPGGAQRDGADVAIQRGADQLPADARRRLVQRHHAALRRRLRRVRQRQDGAEVQSRPLPRFRDERQRVHEQQPGRPHRPHGTRNWDDRTFPVGDPRRDNKVIDCDIMNFAANGECPAATGNDPQLRRGLGHHHPGEPGDAARLGRPSERLAVGNHPAAGGDPAPVGGGRLQPPVVPGGQGDRQHASRARGLRAVHDHWPRRIRGCPAAAATRSRCRW